MNNKTLVIIVVVIIILGGWYYLSQPTSNQPTPTTGGPNNGTSVKPTTPDMAGQTAANDDLIKVTTPTIKQLVTSPLTIKGEARGTWYSEAVFPVKMVDANGTVLGTTQAHAQGDWMTQNYVPFSAMITFSPPSTPSGKLILQKDNPSGLPQNANQLEIPVNFTVQNTQ